MSSSEMPESSPLLGFSSVVRKNATVAICRNGQLVTVVGGSNAQRLITLLKNADDDLIGQLLARATGNYRHGNERQQTRAPEAPRPD